MPRNLSPSTTRAAPVAGADAQTIPLFDRLSDSAFVREAQLVQSPKRPYAAAPWPFSAASYHRKIRAGLLPKPIKLSERVSVQMVGECRAISKAWAAGKSEEQIRVLVSRLHAMRAEHPTLSGSQS